MTDEAQNNPEDAPESTETASGRDSGPTPAPDADEAREALVQQIAEGGPCESPSLTCKHNWVSTHQPDFPAAVYWVRQCNLCHAFDGADLTEQVEAAVIAQRDRADRNAERAHDAEAQVAAAIGSGPALYEQAMDAVLARAERVEAQVAPLRDERDKAVEAHRIMVSQYEPVRQALLAAQERADSAEDETADVREAWAVEARELRAERDAAESALRQVRDLADEWRAKGVTSVYESAVELAEMIDAALARVGAADTQPEGAGEANCHECSGTICAECGYCRESQAHRDWPGHATPTAGSNGDTAPEADGDYGCVTHQAYWEVGAPVCDAIRAGAVGGGPCVAGLRPADTAPESGEGR